MNIFIDKSVIFSASEAESVVEQASLTIKKYLSQLEASDWQFSTIITILDFSLLYFDTISLFETFFQIISQVRARFPVFVPLYIFRCSI